MAASNDPLVSYPDSWVVDVVLADGATMELRPIRPDDARAVRQLLSSLSPDALRFRFFTQRRRFSDEEIERVTVVDYDDRMAFVAFSGGELVGVGGYEREAASRAEAELGFIVHDEHQGRGIGTLLLEHLAAYATTRGIERFIGLTLGDNTKMLTVFDRAGWTVRKFFEDGAWHVSFVLDGAAVDATIERERQADVRAARRILEPESVAVVGASRRPESIGYAVLRSILDAGFTGVVHPVNPNASAVAGVKAYPSVASIGDPIDLAIIAVPAPAVADAVRDCAAAGVGGVVVISAGFAEIGGDGRDRQHEIVDIVRGSGMRLVGPNCLGVLNATEDVSLNATFVGTPPRSGPIAFLSQSGALGLAILDHARDLGLGLSSFVSVGNKADLSGNDFLQYWEDDTTTSVILLYLESFGNPRKFSRIARRVSRAKPVVAVKSGRSQAGRRGAASHTAALTSSDLMTDALFRQAGIIRVDTLEELFDVARVLVHQPLPSGRRVAIVGNSGGPGILATDACVGAGLEVPELSEDTQAVLRSMLAPGAGVSNPVDLVADSGPESYRDALHVLLTDDGVDAVIVIYASRSGRPEVAAPALDAIRNGAVINPDKPVLAVFMQAGTADPLIELGEGAAIPVFPFPESPARALGRIVQLVDWRNRPVGSVPDFDGIDRADRSGDRSIRRWARRSVPRGVGCVPSRRGSCSRPTGSICFRPSRSTLLLRRPAPHATWEARLR